MLWGPAHARAAGELNGKTLKPSTNAQSGLQTALGSLIAGSLKGEVTEVAVVTDQERRVTLTVRYSGFEGAKLWVEVAGSDKKTQKAIRCGEPQAVPAGSGDLEVAAELDPATPEGTTIKSRYLRVCVSRADRATPSYVRGFDFPKTWTVPLNPETMVLTIAPKPVGSTASLGSSPPSTLPLPPRVIRPEVMRAVTMSSGARLMIAAPSSGTTAAAPSSSGSVRPITGVTRAPMMARTTTPPAGAASPMVANRAIILKADPAIRVMPRGVALGNLNAGVLGVPDDAKRAGAKGPSAAAIEPLGQVRTEDIEIDPSHILGIFPQVYPDQEASTGYYYFLPYSYSLRWDPEEGYDLRMIYSATGTSGQAGEVAMAARLDAGIGLKERQVATDVVRAYAKANGLPELKELRAMPIDSIAVSFSDDLRRYNIPADKIAVTGLSDFLGQIAVSWITDPVTKENLQQALVEDVGISGKVTLYPAGHALGPVDVPIQIRLADFGTFGPFRWSRAERWRNTTPYPLKLKYIHALMLDPSSNPVVYSWSLGSTAVPPRAQVQWNAMQVPSWVEGQSKRLWIEYGVDATCGSCDDQVIRSITGGVSTVGPSQLTFHTITPLADAGALEIVTKVRSRFFDPTSREPQVRTVVLNADGKDFILGPFYAAGQESGESNPLFEYQFAITMQNGQVYEADRWIAWNDLRLPVGRHQLEEAFGSLPASH